MAFASSCRQGIIPIKAKGKGFGSQALSYVLIGRFPCSRTEPGISTVIRNFDFSTAPSSLASYYQLMCPEVGGGGSISIFISILVQSSACWIIPLPSPESINLVTRLPVYKVIDVLLLNIVMITDQIHDVACASNTLRYSAGKCDTPGICVL